ncbi:MAG: hypothetical protein NWE76_10710 [Candidatus Bathyarchaeota archaeon]|nr:hypothetical protein [Candidatus Bathyarchaeota archaeon]
MPEGTPVVHSSMTVISNELSDFLAVDPKAMIEALTSLYDSPDKWEYETSGEGTDKLFKVCVNCFLATTPDWMANNLPQEAIGGGFTTRVMIISGKDKYKWISLPPIPDDKLYTRLRYDLKAIGSLVGEFTWGPGAYEYYDRWYSTIPEKTRNLRDARLRGNLSRAHIAAIKTAMCIHVSRADELVIEVADLEQAIRMVEESLNTASEALSGHGRSRTAVDTEKVLRQLKVHEQIHFKDLLMINYHDTNKPELTEVLFTIEGMGRCKMEVNVDSFGHPKIGMIQHIPYARQGKGGKREKERKEKKP